MTRSIFVHETIDIVGQGQYDYMEHVAKEPTNIMPDMTTLQGSFFLLGFGGAKCPQVINIWDCGSDGWEGWSRNLDRLNLKRRSSFYGEWWDEASKWRSGGFDRVCGGVEGSPSTVEIAEKGIKGSLFINEVLTVRSGEQVNFLNEVVAKRVPLMDEYNVVPTGLWEVTTNSREVVMIWATSVDDWTRFRKNLDTTKGLDDSGEKDHRLLEYQNLISNYVVDGDSHLMTPLPGTVYGPSDWEQASIDDWYEDER